MGLDMYPLIYNLKYMQVSCKIKWNHMKEKNNCSTALITFKQLADGKLTVDHKKGNHKMTWLNPVNKAIVIKLDFKFRPFWN